MKKPFASVALSLVMQAIFCLSLKTLSAREQALSVDDALAAYRKSRIAEARAGFQGVLADKGASARDQAIAARELARIEWLVDGDASRAQVSASISVHEGRHVLDQKEYRGTDALSPEELEYRGKLSELQFSEHPRMVLARIVAGQIGGQSAHAKANTRILIGLGKWLESNAAAVTDLDPTCPMLSQIDRLSDGQIRSFACDADPACQKKAPTTLLLMRGWW